MSFNYKNPFIFIPYLYNFYYIGEKSLLKKEPNSLMNTMSNSSKHQQKQVKTSKKSNISFINFKKTPKKNVIIYNYQAFLKMSFAIYEKIENGKIDLEGEVFSFKLCFFNENWGFLGQNVGIKKTNLTPGSDGIQLNAVNKNENEKICQGCCMK